MCGFTDRQTDRQTDREDRTGQDRTGQDRTGEKNKNTHTHARACLPACLSVSSVLYLL